MQRFKRALCLFCMLVMLASLLSLSAHGAPAEAPSTEEAGAVWFSHLESGQVVVKKNHTVRLDAGSTVKVMSGLLLCEMADGNLDNTVVVTKEMLQGVSGYRLYLSQGDILSVKDLLYAAVCGSYNDAFYALCIYFGGSMDAFVAKMNARATELDLVDTVYTDPVGMGGNSVTTAEEVGKVALMATQNKLYAEICKVAKFVFPAIQEVGDRTLYNRNDMIASKTTNRYYNRRCIGMSAGSTSAAGQCVVAWAEDNGESYLTVVLNGREESDVSYGYVIANRLINWVYQTYSYIEVVTPETVICTLPVTMSDLITEVEVRANEPISLYLPAGAEVGREVQYSIRLLYRELEAPVTEGTHVGYLAIVYDERTVGTVELYTAGGAERNNIMGGLGWLKSLTQNRPVMAGLIFFALGLTAWITTESIIHARRRHKWDKYFGNKMGVHPDLYKINQKKVKK